jgi:hypothetical protein
MHPSNPLFLLMSLGWPEFRLGIAPRDFAVQYGRMPIARE